MKKNIIITSVLFGLFVLLTVLVKCVDVGKTSDGIEVGLYSLNSKLLPTNASTTMDKISDICLYLSFLAFAAVAGLGVYQLVKRKSFKKVNFEIYVFAAVSILVVIAYIVFDKIVINYRPILVDGVKEASFPSSHVLLTTYFTFGATYVYSFIIKKKDIVVGCGIIATTVSLITFFGRIMSMNHWFTDSVAGLILAMSFVMLLITLTKVLKDKFKINQI